MASMLTINPHKRKAKRKRPSAKQVAARKKFAAMSRARAKAAKGVKKNPRKRRKARPIKRNPSAPMAKRKTSRRRRSSGFKLFRRKAKRNPIVSRSFMTSTLAPAAVGAVGATINDVAVGYLVAKLPASLQAPEMRQLVKGVAAVGLAALAGKAKIASSGTIKKGLDGALTCALHDAMRTQLQKFTPGVALGEYLSEVTGPFAVNRIGTMGEQISEYLYDDPSDLNVEMGYDYDGDADFDIEANGLEVY